MNNKNTQILIIGFGSIGQRHYNNLLNLGFDNINVFDPDDKKFFNNNINRIKKIDLEILKNFDAAFICNPNNLHIETALKCAEAGCHLFIEKPLSHNFNGINKLIEICERKKLINMVACNMRFHPCLAFIKKYLDSNKLKKIYSISHEFGYYLPYWRIGTDYTKNYAAKKSMGGGIILDDIHEFDLLFWLNDFENVKETKFIYEKISNLKINTEDICNASFKFTNKVIGSIKCDYLQQKYNRNCIIVAEKGNLKWDWNENIVWLCTKNKAQKLFETKRYDLNQMYIDEIKYFFSCVGKKQKTFNNIKIANIILKYCINRV